MGIWSCAKRLLLLFVNLPVTFDEEEMVSSFDIEIIDIHLVLTIWARDSITDCGKLRTNTIHKLVRDLK